MLSAFPPRKTQIFTKHTMSFSVSCMDLHLWSLSSRARPPILCSPSVSSAIIPGSKTSWGFTDIIRPLQAKLKRGNVRFLPTCKAISNSHQIQEYGKVPICLKWLEIAKDDMEEEALRGRSSQNLEVSETNEIRKRIYAVKLMLSSMGDGESNVSAYDTAWVALIKDVNGSDAPQFPSAIEWIANNQHPDGSWGDSELFLLYDRLLNTLACVVALKSWNIHPEKCEKGMKFFKENLSKLGDENDGHMLIGFEVTFPALLDMARSLNIQVPEDSAVLKDIFAKRDLKLKKIPREVMHKVPTSLLYSLEGMSNLDWNQLLKLQSSDGSFLSSPASTACCVAQTKNEKALEYLNKTIKKYNGGVPNGWPVDLFERNWVVDRLERLGISRYFQEEIKQCVDYVSRFWLEKGISWGRYTEVKDIDDTAMGFRVLRLHGHQVSSNVFKHFEKNGEFFCFVGQSQQSVTAMFNLYRAAQLLFPKEQILKDAKDFSFRFLTEKRVESELSDKWLITKDLAGEVSYALDMPWYANLPRLEARFYIEQYGGKDDVWIGKVLYRMPFVNNNVYLELAKLDYNNIQALHCTEWDNIQRWYSECGLEEFGLSRERLLLNYYLAAASIFEPERSHERLAWAKTATLMETITLSYMKNSESKRAFVNRYNKYISGQECTIDRMLNKNKKEEKLLQILFGTLDYLALDSFFFHGQEISYALLQAWQRWLTSWQNEGEMPQREAELLIQTINISAGHCLEELQLNPQYQRLQEITNEICYLLRNYQITKSQVDESGCRKLSTNKISSSEIESGMQELVQLVLQNSSHGGLHSNVKNTFLLVAKSFYYVAYFDPETIPSHIDKVLFHKVM